MESLQELRKQLDEIDAQIVDLYQKRMDVCGKVGEYKVATGKKVFDKQREGDERNNRSYYRGGVSALGSVHSYHVD